MEINTYYKRFIVIFFLGKLFIIGFTFFLASFDVYAYHQIRDIQYIIVPTFATSLIVFLNFLKKNRRNTVAQVSHTELDEFVSKTEVVIVFSVLTFYLLFLFFQLLTLEASTDAFIGLKTRIAFAETLCGGLIGWVLLEINNHLR